LQGFQEYGRTFYHSTFDPAMWSNPDQLYVYSLNEWAKGAYIDPGQLYGVPACA